MVAWAAVIDELVTPSDGQQSEGASTGFLPLIKLREVTAQNQYTNCFWSFVIDFKTKLVEYIEI